MVHHNRLPPRLLRAALLVAVTALTGCSHGETLAKAKGPFFALNPDHWQATPQELEAPPVDPNP